MTLTLVINLYGQNDAWDRNALSYNNFILQNAVVSGKSNSQKIPCRGFPGDSVVKNSPANAGDMGSIPGLERSHIPWSN